MAPTYRNTLRSHAESLARLGKAYTQLASRHRVVASAVDGGKQKKITAETHFTDWIFRACEFAAAAERLLALEVELARSFGITWDEIADALGVSRQAAWERFAKQSRWDKGRRISQVNHARRAEMVRELRERIGASGDELLAFKQWLEQKPNSTPPNNS